MSNKSHGLRRGLTPRFSDTFDRFDLQKWKIWRGSVEALKGRVQLSGSSSAKPGPGIICFAGFGSRLGSPVVEG